MICSLAFLPFIILAIVAIVIFAVYSFSSPLKKKMQELMGSVNYKGEGVFTVDGRPVSIKYFAGSRNRSPEFRMFIPGPFLADLVIRRETKCDTFFKQIGLNKEVPVYDQELADKFYFECDIPEFLQPLLSRHDIKPLLLDILGTFDFIEIARDTCTFRKYPSGNLENISKDFILEAARKLLKFSSCLPPSIVEPHPELAAFKVWRAVLYVTGSAAVMAGFSFLIWAGISYRVVDDYKAWSLAAEWFGVIFAVTAWLAFLAVKGFSTSARVYIYFIITFGIGLLLCLRFGGAVYNGSVDSSPIKKFDVVVINKYVSRGKNSTSYYVVASPWRPGMSGWSFKVTRSVYDQVRISQTPCLVATRSGHLGFEWVVYQTLGLTGR